MNSNEITVAASDWLTALLPRSTASKSEQSLHFRRGAAPRRAQCECDNAAVDS